MHLAAFLSAWLDLVQKNEVEVKTATITESKNNNIYNSKKTPFFNGAFIHREF